MKTHMNTGYAILPKVYREITMLNYSHTDTEFKHKVIFYGPDQYIMKDFKCLESWEIFSADPRSNQTVLRLSFRIKWLSKPFGIWSVADSKIKAGVKKVEKEITTWFNQAAIDFLDKAHES